MKELENVVLVKNYLDTHPPVLKATRQKQEERPTGAVERPKNYGLHTEFKDSACAEDVKAWREILKVYIPKCPEGTLYG